MSDVKVYIVTLDGETLALCRCPQQWPKCVYPAHVGCRVADSFATYAKARALVRQYQRAIRTLVEKNQMAPSYAEQMIDSFSVRAVRLP